MEIGVAHIETAMAQDDSSVKVCQGMSITLQSKRPLKDMVKYLIYWPMKINQLSLKLGVLWKGSFGLNIFGLKRSRRSYRGSEQHVSIPKNSCALCSRVEIGKSDRD